MKLFFLPFILCNFSYIYAQENTVKDKRRILFYVFESTSTSTKKEIISKSLGRISDSSLIADVALIVERNNGNIDTVSCKYNNNIISFKKIDTSNSDIIKIFLSVKLSFSNYKNRFDERLTFPYKPILEQTNSNSDVSISFEHQRNNLYRISISKLDYPFIVSSQYLPSEIIGLYNNRKRH